ncbi:MAG TPA: hypothetical protein VFR85_02620 [Anaeromyxobacteraceae bacterium]|nr:hypothetical protein [Anaeromyxobacteraceae bacterium]
MGVTHSKRRFALLAAAGILACSGEVTQTGTAAPNEIVVQVQPPSAQVAPGGGVNFAAVVTGTANTTVTWSVQEGAPGGSVTTAGAYTAPAAAGTYHVVATSQADSARFGAATVTVTLAPVVAVAISPKTVSVAAGGTRTFTAAVTGTTNTAVTWSLQEASGCGSVTQAGVYTAPAAAATCHVVATSVADPTKNDVATVTVTAPPPPVTVSITPPSASTNSCLVLNFTATVTGSTNTAVTWSVQEGAAGGTVTAAGAYTAPANAGTYHVVATSQADPTKSAVAAVTVTDRIVSVAVTPSTTSVQAGGTAQFTATVTTTCGSFASKMTLPVPN